MDTVKVGDWIRSVSDECTGISIGDVVQVLRMDGTDIAFYDRVGDFRWRPRNRYELASHTPSTPTKVTSDGGSTSYYQLPEGATELNDLIEHKNMSFAQGNIFKAAYRLGEKNGIDSAYDLKKIIFFAERMLKNLEKSSG